MINFNAPGDEAELDRGHFSAGGGSAAVQAPGAAGDCPADLRTVSLFGVVKRICFENFLVIVYRGAD